MLRRALCPVLIDREETFTILEDALIAAHHGDAGVVLLAAEAGMGKTRVASTLARRAERLGFAVLWGACSQAELAVPYLPFLEAIGNHLARVDVGVMRARLGPASHELAHLFPQLGPSPPSQESDDPIHAKLRLYESIVTLLRLIAGERGLLLVVDDVHWADASARELLDYAARRLRDARVLIVATYRSDEMHRRHPLAPVVQGWRRSKLAHVVELEPFDSAQVAAMVAAILDHEDVRLDVGALLQKRSEGNPFVVEELLKDALDRDIPTSDGAWDLHSLRALELPPTVADTILLRVDRLDSAHADVLRHAAVLGEEFDTTLLADVIDASRADVAAAVRACIAEQLLDETGEPDCFRFRHALTREAVYGDLSASNRRDTHSDAADVLRARPGTALEVLAGHLLAAGRLTEAAPVCIAAAEEAMRRQAAEVAVGLYERALALVTGDAERGRLLCSLGEAHWWAAEPAPAARRLEDGIALLDKAGDMSGSAAHRVTLARAYIELRERDRAEEQLQRAIADLSAAGEGRPLAQAYILLGRRRYFHARLGEAVALDERARDVAIEADADDSRLAVGVELGLYLAEDGDVDGGLRLLDATRDEARARGLPWIAAEAALHRATVLTYNLRARESLVLLAELRAGPTNPWTECKLAYWEFDARLFLGDVDGAAAAAQRTIALARGGRIPSWEDFIRTSAAEIDIERARFDDAERALPDVLHDRDRHDGVWLAYYRVRLHRARGEGDRELAYAEQAARGPVTLRMALPLATAAHTLLAAGRAGDVEALLDRMSTVRGYERSGWFQQAAGEVALARGDLDGAEAMLRRAVDAFAGAGYRLCEGRGRLALAGLRVARSEPGAARAELERVVALARSCGSALLERETVDVARRAGVNDLGPVDADERAAMPAGAPVADDARETIVTVMVADVRGYTPMTAANTPADMTDRMRSFYRWSRREAEARKGLVDEFRGDSVMATFNVTAARLDHTVNAVRTAVALIGKAALMGLPVGVGIAVGPSVVGHLSGDPQLLVIGEPANLAARLQAAAAAGELLLSDEAFRRAGAWLASRGIEAEGRELVLKGIAQPVVARVVRAAALAGADHVRPLDDP